MNKHNVNEGFDAPLFSARARIAFSSVINPMADRAVLNPSARDAIVNCVGGWRKLVPAFVGIEQPSPRTR